MVDISNLPPGKYQSFQGDMNVLSDCLPNCKSCTSSLDCSECFDGHFLIGSICFECSQECATCVDHRSKCLSCKNPLNSLINNQVEINNCNYNSDLNCNTFVEGECLKCKPGYSLSLTGCIQCPTGQYFDKAFQFCKDCLPGCINCSNFFSCDLCAAEYDLISGLCHFNPNCVEAYFFDNTVNKCLKCIPNCYSCENNFECIECFVGSYLDNSICIKCLPNCYQCKDGQTCIECNRGYFWKDNKCAIIVDDPNPILLHSSSNENDKNKTLPFNADSTKNSENSLNEELSPISFVASNCMYSNSSGCQFCYPKYVLDGSICKKCVDNCLLCDTIGNCRKCEYGFDFIEKDNKTVCGRNEVRLINLLEHQNRRQKSSKDL
jgi:hypothetical protein